MENCKPQGAFQKIKTFLTWVSWGVTRYFYMTAIGLKLNHSNWQPLMTMTMKNIFSAKIMQLATEQCYEYTVNKSNLGKKT